MIASLPMYWQTANASSWSLFWEAVRARLPGLPALTGPADLPRDWDDHWLSHDLALSQTCGLPFRARLHANVTYVGTFDFALPGTPPGFYHSVVVTRADETRPCEALRLAYNAPDSQSGWAATEGSRFAGHLHTGAHCASVEAVANGAADIAYIDAVTWRILCRADPGLTSRVTARATTPPTPGLPLITALHRDPEPLRAAISEALAVLPEDVRMDMGAPVGLRVLRKKSYLALPIPAPPPS